MYYTVYKITNLINGKIYVGVHRTSNLNDSYMGSGMLIKQAITKHGVENFEREYLAVFDNPEDMYDMESKIVNEEFINSPSSYNLATGGYGGCPISGSKGGKNCAAKYKTDPALAEERYFRNKLRFEELKKQGKCLGGPKFKGMKHTEETKAKIGASISKKCRGENNSQFGTMWITDKVTNKKISKFEPIPEGWEKGRIIK
jgi:group I intron endonuclease